MKFLTFLFGVAFMLGIIGIFKYNTGSSYGLFSTIMSVAIYSAICLILFTERD